MDEQEEPLYRVRIQYHHLTSKELNVLVDLLSASPFGKPRTRGDYYRPHANMEVEKCPRVYSAGEGIWDFDYGNENQIHDWGEEE